MLRRRVAPPHGARNTRRRRYRLDDRLFFANARYFKGRVREAIRAAPALVSWLVFDAEAVTYVDSTGLEALGRLAKDLRPDEITFVVARLRTRMEEQFALAGVTETIGRERLYPTVRATVEAASARGRPRGQPRREPRRRGRDSCPVGRELEHDGVVAEPLQLPGKRPRATPTATARLRMFLQTGGQDRLTRCADASQHTPFGLLTGVSLLHSLGPRPRAWLGQWAMIGHALSLVLASRDPSHGPGGANTTVRSASEA
jgi:anti-anti-sigma regulatory factor